VKIVLHADDFGASANVNQNIIQAWLVSGVDSVSVIANGDALEEGASAVNSHRETPLRIITHLNLSEGYPIIRPSRVPLLIDKSRRLGYGFLSLWLKWLSYSSNLRESLLYQVELEWEEQIKKVKSAFFPRPVSGLDGHVHIHMLPFLFPIAIKLAKKFQLPEIRVSNEVFHYSAQERMCMRFFVNLFKHALLNILAIRARKIAIINNISIPDSVAGVLYSGFMSQSTTESAIKAAMRRNLNSIEVIFHPGRANPQEISRWAGSPSIGKFYLDSRRDCEKDALLSIRKNLSHLL
jgi:predicted glycoside hydrolase/deacetylase ChbG (UPF0249 family)